MSDGESEDIALINDDGEADNNELTKATIEFLNEHSQARVLSLTPGTSQLTLEAYIEYLGIDMGFEPEIVWVAREMLAAPMPPNAEMLVAKSGYIYFHDLENDYYTFEHPLTQRYLKVLEKERLDLLCLRSKPSVNNLQNHQPTALFFKKYPHMNIPCELCNVNVSTRRCHQCMQFTCAECWDAVHKNAEGPRAQHTWSVTSAGAFCSVDGKKKAQLYDANEGEYYTFKNWQELHNKGNRRNNTAMVLPTNDGEIVGSFRCEDCEDASAAFRCDQCMDYFCCKCFWKTHLNGQRRKHTVTKVMVQPMCNQCTKVRATLYDEQSHELLCTDCFTLGNWKGNRAFHLFTSAENLLLLLEKQDAQMAEHMGRARPRVLWAITQLQGWCRGIEARKAYRKEKQLIMKIQQKWRGAMTRGKLVKLLEMYNFRKRQCNDYFLGSTAQNRKNQQKRFLSYQHGKEVTLAATSKTLRDLRTTVLGSRAANPMEDVAQTGGLMTKSTAVEAQTGPLINVPAYGSKDTVVDMFQSGVTSHQQHKTTLNAANIAFTEMAIEETGAAPMNLTSKDTKDKTQAQLKSVLQVTDMVEEEDDLA